MRPVNLIPRDERRGERGETRSGPLPYVVVGFLALVLGATVMLVTTGTKIDDRNAEIASLEVREAAAAAKAAALQPYTEFALLAQTREATVAQLATSRFDWERVMNELALVIPENVWLTELVGTVSPGVEIAGGVGIATRTSVTGPALEVVGCTVSQDAVANFVSALRDIDGVTRVGLDSSALAEDEVQATERSGPGDDCRTRQFIAQFQLVVAFDGATAAAGSTTDAAPTTPVEAPSTAPATTEDPALADAQSERQVAEDSAAQETDKARSAANVVTGVAR